MADQMSSRERQAYNVGVYAVLTQVLECAAAIESMPGYKVTRAGFAVVGLRALADEGTTLLRSQERGLLRQDHQS